LARIKLDPDRRIGTLDRRVFGGFVEHLGRCIHGGVFDEGSSLSDERGYRRDVLAAAKDLRIPIPRWHGGNLVSGYHWTDGIGPREERPRKMDLAWSTEESNRFGTDEFIEYCRMLGAEPYICVNMGTGTMDEAQAWVEYCNGTGDTYWTDLRRKNGHEEPYNVKYCGLGNEMYGEWQIGALSAEDMREIVLDAHVECETHDLTTEASSWPHRVADLGPFDLLDLSATCDAEGRDLTLVVVNRDPEREIKTTIQLADSTFEGTTTAYEVAGESSRSINDFGRQAVGVSKHSVEIGGGSFKYSFPACSIMVLRAGMAG